MTKKLTLIGVALVAVFAIALVAVGDANQAVACDKNAKSASADGCDKAAAASSCSKSAAAKTASAGCDKAAAASSCSKSAAAKTASAGCDKAAAASSCSKSAAAKTASAGCDKAAAASSCSKSAAAKTASAGCDKAAAASSCSKSAAAKTASGDCCLGKAAVAGYSKAKACGDSCTKDCCDADKNHASALKEIVDEIPYGERRRVVVTGSMECGSCTYKATAQCQPLFKTSDGKVYPLAKSIHVKKMKKCGASSFKLTSSVRNIHGVKYLDVKTFKTL